MALPKHIIVLVFLIFSSFLNAQNFNDSWNEHFSYLDIQAFAQSNENIYAATENAIFSYNKVTNEITTITTIQGLSGDNITTLNYTASNNKLYIGYDTGLIQIYNEIDKTTFSVVDILNKPTILPTRKKINDFNIVGDLIYISADFGISVFFVDAEEFGDTYFIGVGNSQITVNQTVVLGDYLYAATEQDFKRGLVSNPNLIDSSQWQAGNLPGEWTNILKTETSLLAVSGNRIYSITGLIATSVLLLPEPILGISSTLTSIAVTTFKRVRIFTTALAMAQEYLAVNYNNTRYSSSVLAPDNTIYIGTTANQPLGKEAYGMLKSSPSNPQEFQAIHPNSPLLNRFFKIEILAGHLWGTHGGHSRTYGLTSSVQRSGISHLFNNEWKKIPYDSIAASVPNPRYLTHISINPLNANNILLSSYWFGVIEIEGQQVIEKYNSQNSSLLPLFSEVHLPLASAYDKNGDYWVVNSRVDQSLNRFQNGNWTSYSLGTIISPPVSNLGYGDIEFDNNGNLFLGSHGYGLISYKEGNGDNTFNNLRGIENNLPSNSIRTVKADNNNQIWFGTSKGLRVIYSPEEYVNGNPIVEEIIVLDNGEASELLYQQYITDIEVDDSNNKWIATLDNGLFYFSPDGQRTIFHFTKDNSPLPSNDILDIAIDKSSGRVYIATEKGLMSYESKTSKPQTTLDNAYVYPNPVRPGFNIVEEKVKIVGLTEDMNIKIVDIEGNLVAEAETKRNGRFKGFNLEIDGGTALWNGKNLAGNIVASGVYVVLLNNLETFETKVLKIMLVR